MRHLSHTFFQFTTSRGRTLAWLQGSLVLLLLLFALATALSLPAPTSLTLLLLSVASVVVTLGLWYHARLHQLHTRLTRLETQLRLQQATKSSLVTPSRLLPVDTDLPLSTSHTRH